MSKRKSQSSAGPNSALCEFLLEIADYEKNVARNIHKYNAYRKAAAVLANQPEKIKSGKEAKNLPGIGTKIADKIDEYLKTGKISKLEKIRSSDDNQIITMLTSIFGIGPAAAKKFFDQGIQTIEDLKKNENLLNRHQKIGVKYFKDFQKKIPREEMEELEEMIISEVKDLDKKYLVTVCGSYRRGAEESGDIDILLTHKKYSSCDEAKPKLLKDVIERLENIGLLKEEISCGGTKYMGVCRLPSNEKRYPHRRIDIRIFPHDQYYCATLYFTGSNIFNQVMRDHANKQGYILNEYCIRRLGKKGTPGEPLPVESERDIFDYIDYPYKTPRQRNV